MKLTRVQKRVLMVADHDHEIIVGGIDGTPGVRRDVIARLAALDLLRWRAPHSLNEESAWVLTAKGHAVLKGE